MRAHVDADFMARTVKVWVTSDDGRRLLKANDFADPVTWRWDEVQEGTEQLPTLVLPDGVLQRTGKSAVVWREPFTPVAGHVHPIQVYDEANVPEVKGAIQIVAADTTTLGDLTREDALAEGFKGFKGDVVALYKIAWVLRYGSNAAGLDDDELVARFDRYWAHKTVWLIELQVHEAQPLFIGRTADYTLSPDATLDPEAGEVIDPVAIAEYARRSYEEKMAANASDPDWVVTAEGVRR